MDRPEDPIAEVVLERQGRVGRIRLNRPKALNALTLGMIHAIDERLHEWAAAEGVAAAVITGEGEKGFCAGGDVRALYDAREDPDSTYRADFYRDEYRLNRSIFRFPKPYVAIMDGITMGGGVGVSVHGSHRVVTERTLFAMPETGIGLFPDVGGSHFLPRCPGALGYYLGLTGARLEAADCLYAGIATHFVPAAKLEVLLARLGDIADRGDVATILDDVAADPGAPPLADHRDAIDRLFEADSISALFAALEADGGEWAREVLAGLRRKSLLSLCVTHRQLNEGRDLDFEDAMVMEYRLSQRFMTGHDFFEGVRAIIIDKDNAPRWQHETPDAVAAEEVDAYFAPLESGELDFD